MKIKKNKLYKKKFNIKRYLTSFKKITILFIRKLFLLTIGQLNSVSRLWKTIVVKYSRVSN